LLAFPRIGAAASDRRDRLLYYVRFKNSQTPMNTEARKPAAQFYPIIIGVALLAAFILSPTPDFLTLIFAGLITVSGSLLVGFAFSRWSGVPLNQPKSSIIAAIIVGAVASTLCFLAIRYPLSAIRYLPLFF